MTDIDVRALRKRLGWNQQKLGRYLGLNVSSVSRIESGGGMRGSTQRMLEFLQEAEANGKAGDDLLPEPAE